MMAGDKFDFNVANSLVQAVDTAASTLAVKNGQMEKKFGSLREGFKDSGYDAYALDMSAANKAVKDVVTQMRVVAKHIAEYAEKLKHILP